MTGIFQKKRTTFLLSILLVFIGSATAYAQVKDVSSDMYIASNIPDSLKKDANSVLRYGIEEDIVSAPGKFIEKHHTIVTVLNEKGDDEAEMVLHYNKKYNRVNSFEMRIYRADGTLIKKYHKSDMYDRSAVDYESVITDDRILAIHHTLSAYPQTIEMTYEIDNKSAIDIGSWAIQHDEQAVQLSYYKITIANNAGFRYANRNTRLKPVKTVNNQLDTYLWQALAIPAVKLEDGAKAWRVLPKIYFSSNSFECYGVPGKFTSWKDYGDWQKALNADVCSLSPQREEEIRKMTDTIKTDKEKAKFLYSYMQKNVRYVSIQLGIGGLKPFPASFVDQKKYGDCKALSNYMSALLKAVHIPSNYAIVNAGPNVEPADASFPHDPFNHVILCIPFKNDTTWLECTSNITRFGKLGAFTENRTALLITDDGGKLVNTPKSTMQDNQFNSEAHIVLSGDGSAKTQVKIFSTGDYRFDFVSATSLKMDEQKERFIRMLNMKQPAAFDINSALDNDGVKEMDLNLEYDKFYDVMAGDKQFYHPRAFDLCAINVPSEEKRKTDYYFENPMQKSCVTTIDLPAGFEVETLPVNQSLKFTYGNYDVNYIYDAKKNQVISTAKFNITTQDIPAAKYTELQQYLDAVAKAQNKKLVIRRKA